MADLSVPREVQPVDASATAVSRPFFASSKPHQPGLALFLNAGDPPLDVLDDVMTMLDEEGVDCVELAVPFPDSATDGPVIRRSARRALDQGVGLDEVLSFIETVHTRLRRLRIALLLDWSHSLKGRDLGTTVRAIAAAGAGGLLVHALPPRLRVSYHAVARDAGLPVVTTCYPSSPWDTKADAAAQASAYLYVVAHYGRSGSAGISAPTALAHTLAELRAHTSAPIAVGFGVRDREDVRKVHECGADAVIVGSAGVARIEEARQRGGDVVGEMRDFVRSIRTTEERIHRDHS